MENNPKYIAWAILRWLILSYGFENINEGKLVRTRKHCNLCQVRYQGDDEEEEGGDQGGEGQAHQLTDKSNSGWWN